MPAKKIYWFRHGFYCHTAPNLYFPTEEAIFYNSQFLEGITKIFITQKNDHFNSLCYVTCADFELGWQ